MKVFLNVSILVVIIVGFSVACQSEVSSEEQASKMKVQNLETFARLYGYARWFHPSDEAQEIDWDKFAVLGVQKVENIKSTAELRDTLYRLFSPIVQGLQIYDARKPEIFDPEILLSPDPDAKPVAWIHSGVYLNDRPTIYKSIRTNTSDIDNIRSSTVLKQFSNPSRLNGKEVRFSGYFKSNTEGTKLFIHSVVMEDYKEHEVSIESQDWKRYEVVLTIPQETTDIFYGFEISGDTEVWADNFEFVVNNGGVWEPIDTANMGFEWGKTGKNSDLPDGWMTFAKFHTVEVVDENSYSGDYCLKISFPGKMSGGMPQFGEITKASIGNNLTCVVPLTLLINDSVTYPQTEPTVLNRLQSELGNVYIHKGFNQQVNLASVIIAWNVLQHFFCYFDVVDTDWNEVLKETLKGTLSNRRMKDFFVTLSQMFAKIEDGHGSVFGKGMLHLPIRTKYIENKIVITASNDTSLRRGDILHKIDGKPVMDVLNEKEKIKPGSPQLRRYLALNILGSKFDPDSTHLVIERDGKEQSLIVSNSKQTSQFFNLIDERPYSSETILEVEPGIYYINMARCMQNEFEQKKDLLANAKAVIYDQRRGQKLHFEHLISYLIEEPVNSTQWNVPITIYPDRKEEVIYSKSDWYIHPKQPLFKSKTIVINDPGVISAGETYIGILDHYNLATFVGEYTAGCNGTINIIEMPCGYSAHFTGMKVLKHDGSQLYLKGFEPDYPVERTIQAVREGRDEYLEKALEVARQ